MIDFTRKLLDLAQVIRTWGGAIADAGAERRGFPLAAIAGKTDIMKHFDKAAVPEDRAYLAAQLVLAGMVPWPSSRGSCGSGGDGRWARKPTAGRRGD
jgi:hypothetical protein